MDFIFIDDVCNIINHILHKCIRGDINLCYMDKYKLSDIANIINNQSSNKVPIQILNDYIRLSYSGCGLKLNNLKLDLKGLKFGITDCYKKLV